MKFVKKNQVIIYVTALMLVVAGYFSFTTNDDMNSAIQASSSEEELMKMANIGDAQLVSSNVYNENNAISNNNLNDSNKTISKDNDKENNINEENKIYSDVNVNETNNVSNENNRNELNKDNTVTTSSNNSKNKSDYFSKSKLERDTMYSQMIESYENILNSSNSLETQKQAAQEEITKINNIKNSIMISENLIKTKGFEDVIVFVNHESISIIVDDDNLNAEKVAQIQNIIEREMNAKTENIHILNK